MDGLRTGWRVRRQEEEKITDLCTRGEHTSAIAQQRSHRQCREHTQANCTSRPTASSKGADKVAKARLLTRRAQGLPGWPPPTGQGRGGPSRSPWGRVSLERLFEGCQRFSQSSPELDHRPRPTRTVSLAVSRPVRSRCTKSGTPPGHCCWLHIDWRVRTFLENREMPFTRVTERVHPDWFTQAN